MIGIEAVKLRKQVLTNPKLAVGEKVLFCLLLDLSMEIRTSLSRGQVIASSAYLSQQLSVSKHSIWKWTQGLKEGGLVSTSKHFVHSHWPITKFCITGLSGQVQEAA